MEQEIKDRIASSVEDFHLPDYREIPNVGLYLEQVTKYVAEYVEPLTGITITSSMISNYVKKKIISNPVKKMYDRDQIAYIIFVAIAKSVLSLENIQRMIKIQQECYSCQDAYNYFCTELENYIRYVYGLLDSPTTIGKDETDEKILLRKLIIAIANTNYMETYFHVDVSDTKR